ncbi:hypothetical protein Gotur_021412 [Gossypium turneri]
MVMEEGATATPISYPGLGKNRQVPCKPGGGDCLPPPSNGRAKEPTTDAYILNSSCPIGNIWPNDRHQMCERLG